MGESLIPVVGIFATAVWIKTGDYGMTWRGLVKFLLVSTSLYFWLLFLRSQIGNW